ARHLHADSARRLHLVAREVAARRESASQLPVVTRRRGRVSQVLDDARPRPITVLQHGDRSCNGLTRSPSGPSPSSSPQRLVLSPLRLSHGLLVLALLCGATWNRSEYFPQRKHLSVTPCSLSMTTRQPVSCSP